MAKIADGSGPAWHRMGDVGRIDERGRLWMCGRKVHRVVVGDATMFTIPCEAPFRTHPAVFRAGLVGVHRNGQTVPVLCVEREPGHPIADASLRAELAEIAARHVHTRAIRTFLFHPGFPVDVRHNAKIFREQLAVWAEDRVP
jgi:acyl-coenzyme A synthetase/AMP-(fatty) acid ligase